MPPGFLGARWWGERRDGSCGRGSLEEWKGSTGKWVSLCRSRATGHAPRLSSSSLRWGLLSEPSKESKGNRSSKKKSSIVWHAPTGRRVLDTRNPRPLPSYDFVSPAFSSCVNWIIFFPNLSFARYLHDILISPRERQRMIHLISHVSLYQLFCSYWYIIFAETIASIIIIIS